MPPEPAKRIDLHCHSDASNTTAEVALNAISCPECYSSPSDVYGQARRRGMDFVTITDHDTIAGVTRLLDRPDVLVGEELTCWFPEDGCKLHVLVFGITADDHAQLQRRAANIYDVADYVESQAIAHAVAHPIYRQNEKLERWHVERLLLLFKGFECLNGAHSSLHREAFEPLLDKLSEREIQRLSDLHDLRPRWPQPHIKARTGGSDDHGLLNVGRTWTEFPPETRTPADLLECLRTGRCHPGGETGSSAKLAHAFYSVAVRYYSRHILSPGQAPNLATMLLQMIVGERRAPTRWQMARMALRHKLRRLTRRLAAPLSRDGEPSFGTQRLKRLFIQSARDRKLEHPGLRGALESGLPPLGEHEEMFRFITSINRDVTRGLAEAINRSVDDASFTGLFDSIGAILAQQFVLLPYYFAVFHQNKERHLLHEITRQHTLKNAQTLRVGLFTDTLDEINGVGRFVRDMAEQAQRTGAHLTVHTCCDDPRLDLPNRKNFLPLLSRPLPYYEELQLNLPPLLEVLEWSDRQQFDAIHVSTPGPMGLCGWIVSRMLRVPLLATYHTDFPAYVDSLTRDHRAVQGATQYMKWFYRSAATVFARSRPYHFSLRDLGVPQENLATILPGINTDKFNARHRDPSIWERLAVREPRRVLYVGRVSVEKNLPLLADAFRGLCSIRRDTALVVAGDGPYRSEMASALAGLPAFFLGFQDDAQLGRLYAGADLFAFPSRTDTLGQVVMEAQASGCPVLVSDEGGPRDMTDDGVTGIVLPASKPADAERWCSALNDLLDDEPRRQRMARLAPPWIASRYSLEQTFAHFWAEHVRAAEPPASAEPEIALAPRQRLKV